MTVVVNIGRRVPKNWFKRLANKAAGLISFQENLWIIIKQSLTKAKKAANVDGRVNFVMTYETEPEDLHYQLEWIKIKIQGAEKAEEEEYNEALGMYKKVNKLFKNEMPKDERMSKHFKTKILTSDKVQDAYKAGYGSLGDNNLANKMLEMGILTHIEWVKDFETRDTLPLN